MDREYEYTLSMSFTTVIGDKNFNLSLSDVREDLTKEEIEGVMDIIIAKDIFKNSEGKLKAKNGCKVTKKKVQKFEDLYTLE